MMSSLTIRQATASDKEAVIRIHDNVYDGLDYIAEYFDEFISCPLITPYVALLDGKIIGFVATFIVDDGKTVVTRAGRLSPAVGGQGFYKQFHAHVLHSSGVSRHAFTTANTHPSANKDSFRSVNKLILMKPFTRFLVDARSLQTLDVKTGALHYPTDEDLKVYFSSFAIRRYLFPKDRLIVNWVPFRLTEANISLIRCPGTKIFSDVSVKDDRRVEGLLTFSTTFPVKKPPYCCHFYVYGIDTSTLKHHMISHLRSIRDVTDGVTSLLVYVEPDFDMQELEKTFREIGLQRSDWYASEYPDKMYSQQMLFEKEI